MATLFPTSMHVVGAAIVAGIHEDGKHLLLFGAEAAAAAAAMAESVNQRAQHER